MNRPVPRPFWLISRTDAGSSGILTAELAGGEKALPVFSFEDEAGMFLGLGTLRDGWRVRETTTGELVSILLGPCADVEWVLLDPLPDLDGREATELVGMPRKAFVEHQLGRQAYRKLPGEHRQAHRTLHPGGNPAVARGPEAVGPLFQAR
ncbi:MAG: hypothetical protein M3522_01280 [Actinomycetota bacterium]|nr:hypothetical protein [Actinomycetota bacterium]